MTKGTYLDTGNKDPVLSTRYFLSVSIYFLTHQSLNMSWSVDILYDLIKTFTRVCFNKNGLQ